jgi:hypothetical protein
MPKRVTAINENLFQIAAARFGDATKWIYIAELNQIRDPFIQEICTLEIPAASNLQGGGIVLQ